MKKILFLAPLACLLLAAPVLAQGEAGNESLDGYMELLRQDLRAEKVAILTETLNLTEAEGEAFWPIYREFAVEQAALGDQFLANLKHYAENWDSMDEAAIQTMADNYFKQQSDELKLKQKYFKRVSKEVSVRRAAQFLQVENQIQMLIDLQLASEAPLIK